MASNSFDFSLPKFLDMRFLRANLIGDSEFKGPVDYIIWLAYSSFNVISVYLRT